MRGVTAAPGRLMGRQPELYVIAGPNGSGKTTFAMRFLPEQARNCRFVNADLIAAGLSPFNPDEVATRAGRIFLQRIHELAADRADFGFETTLSGRTYAALLAALRESGYRITLFFLWLPSVRLALKRIAERVSRGGHNVPAEVVRRRFARGVPNLFHVYRDLCDTIVLFDNSGDLPRLVAGMHDPHIEITDHVTYAKILKEARPCP